MSDNTDTVAEVIINFEIPEFVKDLPDHRKTIVIVSEKK